MASVSQEYQGYTQGGGSGKVKVTILASEWGSSKGGLSTINRKLAIQLAKFPEVEITFFVPQCSKGDKKEALSHDINIVEAKKLVGIEDLELLSYPPDDLLIEVVIGHGVKLGRHAQVIRNRHECKWVQVVHTDPEELGMFKSCPDPISKGQEKHYIEVKLCEEADFVVTIGPKLAESFRRYLQSCKNHQTIFDFTPGIFEEFLSVDQGLEERKDCTVLVFGRGDAEDFQLKGFDIVGKAVASLADTHLIFVGAPDGKYQEIAQSLLECDLPANCLKVRGYVKCRESLRKLFCEVDLVVMPSRTEGFGLTGLEALSAGLPVLVSKNSGFGESLSKVPFGSSFVIDSEKPEVWAAAIKNIWDKERQIRLKQVQVLRSSYEQKYSWTKQSEALLVKIINLVCGLGRPTVQIQQIMSSVSQEYQGYTQGGGSGKVKVTILASEWGSSKGGLSTINRKLAIQLAKFPEVEITFFVPQCSQGDKKEALSHSINIVEARKVVGFEGLELLSFPPDDLLIEVVIGHGVKLGRQAQVIRNLHKCKWVQVVCTDPEELGMFKFSLDPISKGQEKHSIEVKLCEKADFVLTIGSKLAESFRRYLQSCKNHQTIFGFTPGIFEEFLSVDQGFEERKYCTVLVFGRGDAEDFQVKGFDIVGKAVASLADTHLIFVGAPDGKYQEIAKSFLECDLPANRLRVRGYVKCRESLRKLFCEVDLVVMPSRTDGFGLTGLEALSAGLPVLVSKNSGFGESLSKVPFGSSFVIDSEKPEVWAAAIKDIWDKERQSRLEEVQVLRSSYERKYSWTEQSDALLFKIINLVRGMRLPFFCMQFELNLRMCHTLMWIACTMFLISLGSIKCLRSLLIDLPHPTY
ncbi:uncharacterized protein [Montipora capricornis]|uniref:uncharacterized protein n=1 Tax=Montipora capricornis TaxID=246305 RepID=UPI0035F11726